MAALIRAQSAAITKLDTRSERYVVAFRAAMRYAAAQECGALDMRAAGDVFCGTDLAPSRQHLYVSAEQVVAEAREVVRLLLDGEAP